MTQPLATKRPGRPSADQNQAVRQNLLDAARELCITVGLDAASTKAIADRAGVNPAMINYYFGGKEALSQAMMRDAMAPLLRQLDAAASGSAGTLSLKQFMHGYMRTLATHRWLPQLVVREVLPPNGRFRALFFSELAERAAKLILALLQKERSAGRLDQKFDLELVLLSLVSLAVFPFLAAPILESVLHLDLDDESLIDRLIEHSSDVLFGGIAPGRTT